MYSFSDILFCLLWTKEPVDILREQGGSCVCLMLPGAGIRWVCVVYDCDMTHVRCMTMRHIHRVSITVGVCFQWESENAGMRWGVMLLSGVGIRWVSNCYNTARRWCQGSGRKYCHKVAAVTGFHHQIEVVLDIDISYISGLWVYVVFLGVYKFRLLNYEIVKIRVIFFMCIFKNECRCCKNLFLNSEHTIILSILCTFIMYFYAQISILRFCFSYHTQSTYFSRLYAYIYKFENTYAKNCTSYSWRWIYVSLILVLFD